MSILNKDEVKGKYEQAKGYVKDKAGELTGNDRLEADGEAQRVSGRGREQWGKIKRGISDAVDAVGETISDAGKKVNQ
jgi:uncharacterized protein YjbJ (UPF0337 family)